MVWWLIIAGGAVALIVYSRRGQNAVWGTATAALPVGFLSAIFLTGVEWVDILRFVAVGALIGLVLEILPSLQRHNSGDWNTRTAEPMVRRRNPVIRAPAMLHQDEQRSFGLSEGLARMPSAPDIEGGEQFFSEQISGHTVLGFRDCSVMAARRGARATLEYPLVLALLDETASEVSMLVAVEKGVMFDTCMLGAFTSEGVHMNMGHWDLDAGEKAFVDEARALFVEHLSCPND